MLEVGAIRISSVHTGLAGNSAFTEVIEIIQGNTDLFVFGATQIRIGLLTGLAAGATDAGTVTGQITMGTVLAIVDAFADLTNLKILRLFTPTAATGAGSVIGASVDSEIIGVITGFITKRRANFGRLVDIGRQIHTFAA